MTAGRGIIHSEMPASNGVNRGLQLWVNLKAKDKMCEPGYQDLKAKDIPRAEVDGSKILVIAGTSHGVTSKGMFFSSHVDQHVQSN
jgi:redox-sensitive bicupin YhaK (pirin superfamily)